MSSDPGRRLRPVADFDVPADLVQLRRRFLEADAARAGDGPAAQQAYRDAQDLAEAIQDHPWWGTVESRFKARMALIAAAKPAETPSL